MAVAFDNTIRRPLLTVVPDWIHPNHFTVVRALLVIPVIALRHEPFWAVSFLILSSIFDILDGALARVRMLTSQYGALLDSISDKVFILGALYFACWGRVPFSIVLVITLLEAALIGIRPLKSKYGAKADSNRWGALKTWSQSFAIAFVLTTSTVLLLLSLYIFGLAIFFAFLSLLFHVRDIRKTKT